MLMNSNGTSSLTMAGLSDVGQRARRRIAYRLLPLVFLLYVVNYIDRVNVSFANLRMSADLGFSDRVYGLGVGMFYITYVLFEIPGAILVERWSARKWIARIMISWGLFAALTGFIHTATEFYGARFMLGLAEAGFFPGILVYVSHWYRQEDRAKAVAFFMVGIPFSEIIGAPVSGLLLQVHWLGIEGWRWLFILEGIPAIVLGIITIFYLTDWPAQARWLPEQERTWLVSELQAELEAKKKKRNFTMMQVFAERRILILVFAYLLAMTGYLGNAYWMPTFVKRVSGFSNKNVTSLLMIPALMGALGMLINGWHSDKTNERHWHTAVPLLAAGCMFFFSSFSHHDATSTIAFLLLGSGFLFAYFPTFWAIPTMMLSEAAAAASFGLINSIGQLGGFTGNYAIGFFNYRTHSLVASFAFLALTYVAAGGLILSLRSRDPTGVDGP